MTPKHLTCCAIAALALLAAAEKPTVLRFAWPESTRARVRYTAERARVLQNGTASSTRTASAYDLHARRSGDQLVVERRRSDAPPAPPPANLWKGEDGKPPPGMNALQALIDGAAEGIPGFVVSADGEFLSVEGTEPLRVELEKVLDGSPLPAGTQETVRGLFTDAALAALAKEQWTVWVGFWKGLSLEADRPLTQRRQGRFPGTGYAIDLVVEARLVGFVACHPPAKDLRCVELRMESRPDPGDVARTIEKLNLSATAGIRDLTMEQTFTVVAEPGTLLPHRCTRTLVAEVEHAPGSGGATTSEKVTETWELDYGP